MTGFNTQFSAGCISLLNLVMHRPAQFSLNNISAMKSMILLEIKCPQLSRPEATAAKKPWEKKTLGETMLSWGALKKSLKYLHDY